jgi:hypothetical protein
MRIIMHSLNTGIVVNITINENIYVQIGSTILNSGIKIMMIDAIITPIDYKRSPIRCTTAAFTFMFYSWE